MRNGSGVLRRNVVRRPWLTGFLAAALLALGGVNAAADLVPGGWLQPPKVEEPPPAPPEPAPVQTSPIVRPPPERRSAPQPVHRQPRPAAPPSDGRVQF